MRYTAITVAAILTIAARPVATPRVSAQASGPAAVLQSEFLYDKAPFPSVHASTIVETRDGLVAAMFGGTREGAADVGIWVSRHVKGAWTAPVEVATGVQPDGTRHPCWNPVLFEMPDRSLALFYKVGPDPRNWWGVVRSSTDAGRDVGRCPAAARRRAGPDQEQARAARGWHDHQSEQQRIERQAEPVARPFRALDRQRTDLDHCPTRARRCERDRACTAFSRVCSCYPGGRLQAVGRTRSGRVFQTWSEDGGRTWSPLGLTTLPNPSSGTDASTLRDGRQLIVYNHTPKGRTPLNIALSRDGTTWEAALVLET